eukprot:2607-Heterococcus_DN1.PRE.11
MLTVVHVEDSAEQLAQNPSRAACLYKHHAAELCTKLMSSISSSSTSSCTSFLRRAMHAVASEQELPSTVSEDECDSNGHALAVCRILN